MLRRGNGGGGDSRGSFDRGLRHDGRRRWWPMARIGRVHVVSLLIRRWQKTWEQEEQNMADLV